MADVARVFPHPRASGGNIAVAAPSYSVDVGEDASPDQAMGRQAGSTGRPDAERTGPIGPKRCQANEADCT